MKSSTRSFGDRALRTPRAVDSTPLADSPIVARNTYLLLSLGVVFGASATAVSVAAYLETFVSVW